MFMGCLRLGLAFGRGNDFSGVFKGNHRNLLFMIWRYELR
jgi:hypothetical protein